MTWRDTSLDGVARSGWPGSASPASWPTRSTSAPGTRLAVWERLVAAGAALRHHAVRHRDHARAARREGLPDHRAGHRRHRHARRTSAWAGRCRRRRSTSSASGPSPAPRTQPAAQAARRPAARSTRQTVLPEGSQIVEPSPTACCRRRRCRCSGTSPPATAAPRWAARSRSPWSRAGAARIGETVHVPVDGTLVPVEITGSVLVDPEGARRDG